MWINFTTLLTVTHMLSAIRGHKDGGAVFSRTGRRRNMCACACKSWSPVAPADVFDVYVFIEQDAVVLRIKPHWRWLSGKKLAFLLNTAVENHHGLLQEECDVGMVMGVVKNLNSMYRTLPSNIDIGVTWQHENQRAPKSKGVKDLQILCCFWDTFNCDQEQQLEQGCQT